MPLGPSWPPWAFLGLRPLSLGLVIAGHDSATHIIRVAIRPSVFTATLLAAFLLLSLRSSGQQPAPTVVPGLGTVAWELLIEPPTLINLGFAWFCSGCTTRATSTSVCAPCRGHRSRAGAADGDRRLCRTSAGPWRAGITSADADLRPAPLNVLKRTERAERPERPERPERSERSERL